MRIYIQWLLLILYTTFIIIGLKHHELWLDEMHHWLLAKDSQNLRELYQNTRYEGHPILWNVLLLIISRFSENPVAMQVLHGFFAILTAFLIVFYTPFPLYLKSFLLFGYFFFYEYAILSRSYVLIVFLVLSICAVYHSFPQKKWLLFCLLFLLANTHLLAIPIFLGFSIFFFWKKWLLQDYFLALFALIGLFLALAQINPPANHPFHHYWSRLHIDINTIARVFNQMGQGWFPISDYRDTAFWNKNIFNTISSVILVVLGFIFLFILLVQTYFHKRLWISIMVVFGGIFSILYFLQMIGFRYYGIVWIALIPIYWFLYTQKPINKQLLYQIFSVMAFIQMLGGVIAYSLDIQKPFSQAKNVVNFIQEKRLENVPLAVSPANAAPSISGYIGKNVYHLDVEAYHSFCLWYKPVREANRKKLFNSLVNFASTSPKVLFVSNYLLHKEDLAYLEDVLKIQLLKHFQPSVIQSEIYWLYLIHKK